MVSISDCILKLSFFNRLENTTSLIPFFHNENSLTPVCSFRDLFERAPGFSSVTNGTRFFFGPRVMNGAERTSFVKWWCNRTNSLLIRTLLVMNMDIFSAVKMIRYREKKRPGTKFFILFFTRNRIGFEKKKNFFFVTTGRCNWHYALIEIDTWIHPIKCLDIIKKSAGMTFQLKKGMCTIFFFFFLDPNE